MTEPSDELSNRLKLARTLVENGSDAEALEEFAWLWQNSLQISPSWVGVRGSFLIAFLRPLIARSPTARDRFAAIRDEAEARLNDRSAMHDWLTLNNLLGDDERFVSWLERLDRATAADLLAIQHHQFLDLIEKFERWSDLARLVEDPVGVLRAEHELSGTLIRDVPDWVRERTLSQFAHKLRRLAGALCRALSASGRTTELSALVAEAHKLDPSAEMADAVRLKGDPPG